MIAHGNGKKILQQIHTHNKNECIKAALFMSSQGVRVTNEAVSIDSEWLLCVTKELQCSQGWCVMCVICCSLTSLSRKGLALIVRLILSTLS